MTKSRTPKVHFFATSGEAYNASQTSEQIADGDVLIVASEHVAAVLVEAWPVALYTRSHLAPNQSGKVLPLQPYEQAGDFDSAFHWLSTSHESWLADNPQYASSDLIARVMLAYSNLDGVPLFRHEAFADLD